MDPNHQSISTRRTTWHAKSSPRNYGREPLQLQQIRCSSGSSQEKLQLLCRPVWGMWDQFSAQGNTGERSPQRKPLPEAKGQLLPLYLSMTHILLGQRGQNHPFSPCRFVEKIMPWRYLATTWLSGAGKPREGFLRFSSFPEEQMLLDGLQPNFAVIPWKIHHFAVQSQYFSIYLSIFRCLKGKIRVTEPFPSLIIFVLPCSNVNMSSPPSPTVPKYLFPWIRTALSLF